MVGPGGAPNRETVKGFAEIMGWDDYSSRLKLRSRVPFILAGYDDASKVHDLASRFSEIGVESFLIKESGLARLEKKQVARSATADETRITLRWTTMLAEDDQLFRFVPAGPGQDPALGRAEKQGGRRGPFIYGDGSRKGL